MIIGSRLARRVNEVVVVGQLAFVGRVAVYPISWQRQSVKLGGAGNSGLGSDDTNPAPGDKRLHLIAAIG